MLNGMATPAKRPPTAAPAGSKGGELALIQHIRSRSAAIRNAELRLGIGDDCAILRPRPGHEVVVTTDLSLEGRHFRRDWHPSASVGHRVLARGLSDIAAMGATPLAAFLSLAVPKSVARDHRWLDGFLDGLLALAAPHHVPLAGGDTSEAPGDSIIADIMVLGSASRRKALRRSGARPGDILYCTGALGGSAAELAALAASPRSFRRANAADIHPHLYPQPRLATGQALLRRNLATACIDISDGLSTDLTHLCEASGVSAELNAASIPLHAASAKLTPEARLEAALHGGEDYELLFTAAPGTRMPRSLGGVAIHAIGRIVPTRKGSAITLIADAGSRAPLLARGWEHFQQP